MHDTLNTVDRGKRKPVFGRIVRCPSRLSFLPPDVRILYARCIGRAWRRLNKRSIIHYVPNIGLMKLNPGDLVGNRLLFYEIWEPIISRFVREHATGTEGATAVDIGANIGYYTLMFSRLVGSRGAVYAIEPAPVIRKLLEENVALNHLSNVTPVAFGISSRCEVRRFHYNTGSNLGASGFGEVYTEEKLEDGCLELRRLKDVMRVEDMTRTMIIKIDVEGMEYPVLRDLLDNLPSFPKLGIVLAELRFDGRGVMDSLVAEFKQRGFAIYAIPNAYEHAFYAAPANESPQRVQHLPPGQHDVALVRPAL